MYSVSNKSKVNSFTTYEIKEFIKTLIFEKVPMEEQLHHQIKNNDKESPKIITKENCDLLVLMKTYQLNKYNFEFYNIVW